MYVKVEARSTVRLCHSNHMWHYWSVTVTPHFESDASDLTTRRYDRCIHISFQWIFLSVLSESMYLHSVSTIRCEFAFFESSSLLDCVAVKGEVPIAYSYVLPTYASRPCSISRSSRCLVHRPPKYLTKRLLQVIIATFTVCFFCCSVRRLE